MVKMSTKIPWCTVEIANEVDFAIPKMFKARIYAYWYGPRNTDVDGIIVENDIKLITNKLAAKPRPKLKLSKIRYATYASIPQIAKLVITEIREYFQLFSTSKPSIKEFE